MSVPQGGKKKKKKTNPKKNPPNTLGKSKKGTSTESD